MHQEQNLRKTQIVNCGGFEEAIGDEKGSAARADWAAGMGVAKEKCGSPMTLLLVNPTLSIPAAEEEGPPLFFYPLMSGLLYALRAGAFVTCRRGRTR